jgi:hypothetical protein
MGISKKMIVTLMLGVAAIVSVVVYANSAQGQVQTCVWPHKCSTPAPITTPCPAGKVCLQ